MISEEEIRVWWERKIEKYIKNYAHRNKLSLAQAKANFFTETHKKFLDSIPQEIQKLLQRCSWVNLNIDSWCTHSKKVEEPTYQSGLNI